MPPGWNYVDPEAGSRREALGSTAAWQLSSKSSSCFYCSIMQPWYYMMTGKSGECASRATN